MEKRINCVNNTLPWVTVKSGGCHAGSWGTCRALGFHINHLPVAETGKCLHSLDCRNAGAESQTRRSVAPACAGPPRWRRHWTPSSNLVGRSWEGPRKGSAACCQKVPLPATRGAQALSPDSDKKADFKNKSHSKCVWQKGNTHALGKYQCCLFSLGAGLLHADLAMTWKTEL